MTLFKMQRIAYTAPDAVARLHALCKQLSLQADVVSPRGRALTEQVFGQALTPAQVVDRICTDVRKNGVAAVLHYTEQFDKTKLAPETIRVDATEFDAAHKAASSEFLATIRRVRDNILSFQSKLVHADVTLTKPDHHELGLRYRPLRRIGVCIPGGAAAYPSTILMTTGPAQAAGVKEIALVMPPTRTGAGNPDLLATCKELGITEVYRIGGAQAVAALAYGIEGLPKVDMIVGPGNIFVTLAKKYVYGDVAIDCLAGPSEVVVIADESASPEFIAADLIAQAEHDPASSILITWHEPLLAKVEEAIARQCANLPRGDLARACLERFGALVLAKDQAQAIEWSNQIAPEHLHLATNNASEMVDKMEYAGAIFVGHYAPVALGDYAAGPSHVLPTGGTARFTSGLSASDFLRRSSVLSFTQQGLAALAPDVRVLAEKEGLTAHSASVDVRLVKE